MNTAEPELPRVRLTRAQWIRLIVVGAFIVFSLARVGPDLVRIFYPLSTFGYSTDGDAVVTSVSPRAAARAAAPERPSSKSKSKSHARAKPPVIYDMVQPGDRVRLDKIKPFDRKPGIAGRGFTYDNPDRMLPIERDGRERKLHLMGVAESPPLRFVAVLRILLFAVSISIGAFLFLVKPSITTAGFFAFTLGADAPTTYMDLVIPNPWRPLPIWIGDTVHGAARAGLLLFALCLYDNSALRQRLYAYATSIAGIGLGLLGAYAAWRLTFEALPSAAYDRWFTDISTAVTAVTTVVFFGALLRTRGGRRRRILWIVIAFAAADIARIATDQLFPGRLPIWLNGSLIVTTVIPAIVVATAVVRQRFFEIDFVVSRAITYVALTAAIIALITTAEEVATYVFYNNTDIAYIATMLLSLAIGATTGKLHRFIEYFADRFIFRDRRAQRQALELIAGYILDAESIEDVYRALLRDCSSALNLAFAGILTRRPDGAYALSDQHEWPNDFDVLLRADDEITLRIARSRSALSFSGKDTRMIQQAFPNERLTFAAPLFYNRKVAAIVVYGTNISGLDLDPQEREQLTRVVAHASIALSAIALSEAQNEPPADLPLPTGKQTV
ncbi:MAG: hypothetical protein NVS3B28_01750 [Candidatus Velthaea sp.]